MNNTGEILLSVIVPFHNEEEAILRCAESLMAQLTDGTEVIFVDDGSTDESAIRLRRAFPTAQIVTHETNRGTAKALRSGYEAAKGKFLLRCDADDYVDKSLFAVMLKNIAHDDADVIEFGIATHEDGDVREEMPSPSHDLNDMPLTTLNFSLCNHAIRRELILNAMPYDGLNCWEDLSVIARLLSTKRNVRRIEGCYYNYVRPTADTTLSVADNKVILTDRIGVANRLVDYFDENGLSEAFRPFLDRLKFSAKARFLARDVRNVKAWKSTFPEINKRIMSIRHIPLRHRLIFAAISRFPSGK